MNLRSVFPPMPTPFKDGEVDTAAIQSNVRKWIAAGLGGVLTVGTNGEAALLEDDEADRVIEAARREVPADRVLLAGAGHESTRATIAAARRAAAAGADAVLVKTPSVYRAHVAAAGLIAHYTAVADASPVPVLLYNFPASTGVNLAPDTVAQLAAHPNIIGMKETSTDGAQFADLAAAVPSGFTVLCGAAPGVFAALCAGAAGAIIAVSSLLPSACLDLLAHVRAGRLDEARALQRRITPLGRAVTTAYGIPGLKAALDLSGYRGGEPRPPLAPLSADAVERIRVLLHGAN
ncbi:MAG TPA: dihydrodipicolinate synthase family protein [Vicinamibacterales bacterium]|nr:dihydrodipicolinate synthase family protein [Vicinamibacterales bacterium]